jgi:hypothetical protein
MELGEFTEEIKTTEAAGAFRAHLRYLQALARIATDGQPRMANAYITLRDKFASSPQRPRIKHAMNGVAEVRRSLENAWGTELLLYMGHQFLKGEEIIRLSNTWNVVQAYYAVYHVTQALLIAKGYVRPEKHATTQALFVELWGKLPECFVPWCLTCKADGHHPATIKLDPKVHVWSMVDAFNCHSLAYKAIRTTRQEALQQRRKLERENKKKALRKRWVEREKLRAAKGRSPRPEPEFPLPQLTKEERASLDTKFRGYSMLDYLYRLRIRSNYVDAGIFIDGPGEPNESRDLRVALIKIVSLSLMAAELVLVTCPDGWKNLREWGVQWSEVNIPKRINFGVGSRIQHWCE